MTTSNDPLPQERYINPYTDFGFKKIFGTDMNNAAVTARKEGIEEGMAKGIEGGMTKGIEEGKRQQAVEIARNLTSIDYPLKDIAATTGESIL